VFRDVRRRASGRFPPQKIFRAVKSIGGEQGWFGFDLLWRIRGVMDKLAGGFGDSVGRRAESNLRVGDILDVWRVIDLRRTGGSSWRRTVKVAGKAWLRVPDRGGYPRPDAYHYPKGVAGQALLVLHAARSTPSSSRT